MGAAKHHDVGQTPVVTAFGDLPEEVADGKVVILHVTKEGYYPKTVYLTETRSVNVEVDIALDKIEVKDDSENMNALIDALFESQAAAKRGDVKTAHKILDGVESRFKSIAAIYELRGGLYLLEKNMPMALRSFSKALELNPTSPDVKVIVRTLKADGRIPASVGEPKPVSTDGAQAPAETTDSAAPDAATAPEPAATDAADGGDQ